MGGAAAAASFLASLRTLMGQRAVQTVSGAFSGPSIPAMISSGLTANLSQQFEAGDATLRSVADVPLATDVARPPIGALSDEALEWLADRGSRVVLADADTVERPVQPLDFSPPATATVPSPSGTDLSLVLPDPGVQGILARPDLLTDPVRASQALLGELAVIWKEEPVPPSPDVRGIAVALTASLPPTIWPTLLERLHAPFLVPVHAADLAANVDPQGPQATLRSPSTGSFPFDYAQSIRDLGRKVDAYASMLTLDSPVPAALDRDLLYAESAPYVADPAAGQQWLDAVAATTQSAFSSVEPQVNKAFTFTSGEGTIPLLMGDPGPIPLRIDRLVAIGPVRVPRRRPQAGGPRATEPGGDLPRRGQGGGAESDRGGGDGTFGRGDRFAQTIVVRSTAVNRIALLVTLGAAAVLALLYLRRWLRRTKTPS